MVAEEAPAGGPRGSGLGPFGKVSRGLRRVSGVPAGFSGIIQRMRDIHSYIQDGNVEEALDSSVRNLGAWTGPDEVRGPIYSGRSLDAETRRSFAFSKLLEVLKNEPGLHSYLREMRKAVPGDIPWSEASEAQKGLFINSWNSFMQQVVDILNDRYDTSWSSQEAKDIVRFVSGLSGAPSMLNTFDVQATLLKDAGLLSVFKSLLGDLRELERINHISLESGVANRTVEGFDRFLRKWNDFRRKLISRHVANIGEEFGELLGDVESKKFLLPTVSSKIYTLVPRLVIEEVVGRQGDPALDVLCKKANAVLSEKNFEQQGDFLTHLVYALPNIRESVGEESFTGFKEDLKRTIRGLAFRPPSKRDYYPVNRLGELKRKLLHMIELPPRDSFPEP